MRQIRIILLFSFVACLSNCTDDKVSSNELEMGPFEPTHFQPEMPDKFPPLTMPDHNMLTEEGVALGRMLFYDPILDADSAKSCSSCHIQEHAFSAAESEFHMDELGIMPHINLAWDKIFLWHGNVEGNLEDIMQFEVEEFFKTDLQRMNASSNYRKLFKQAYDIDEIDYEHIAKALAQFERTLISGNSKFDQYLRDEVQLTEQEFRGFNLFYSESGDCFHCHGTILFKDNLFHNNGLNSEFSGTDQGHFLVSGNPDDMGKFKTPTLRNIALTAPYMHDNRFSTLKEVVDFYSDQVHFTEYTDPLMNHEGGINLTESEKEDLIAFLYTLTDETFISNPAFASPFEAK